MHGAELPVISKTGHSIISFKKLPNMSTNIGGISIEDTIKNAEIRIGALERMVAKLIEIAPEGSISSSDIAEIRREAAQEVEARIPDEVMAPIL